MPESTPATPPTQPDLPTHGPGQTTPAREAEPMFKEPHERDESSASQTRPPDEVMKQAHDDVEDGLVDTSNAEATQATYSRHLRSEPQGAAPETPAPGPSVVKAR